MIKTEKCPICGNPYNIDTDKKGNQSACASCRQKAASNESKAQQKRGMYKTGSVSLPIDVKIDDALINDYSH